jgi:hypothetical protein
LSGKVLVARTGMFSRTMLPLVYSCRSDGEVTGWRIGMHGTMGFRIQPAENANCGAKDLSSS